MNSIFIFFLKGFSGVFFYFFSALFLGVWFGLVYFFYKIIKISLLDEIEGWREKDDEPKSLVSPKERSGDE